MQRNINKPGIVPQPKEVTMKTVRSRMSLAAAMIAFAAILAPQAVMALTAPCTEISNQAELTYSVGGVDQTNAGGDPVLSGTAVGNTDPTIFNVGVKILVTVANANTGYVTVTPSTTVKKWLRYTVTNSGNATHTYTFTGHNGAVATASPFAGGLVDVFNATTTSILVDSGANFDLTTIAAADLAAIDYLTGTDVATTLTLAPDETNVVYVVYTPNDLTAVDEEIAVFFLRALTNWSDALVTPLSATLITDGNDSLSVTDAMSGSAACGAGGVTVDVVLGDMVDGDGDDGLNDAIDDVRDGAHAAKSAFQVATAVIEHIKTYTVISDGINTSAPYNEIPGAVIEYSIAITNSGTAPATLGDITDALDTNFTLLENGASWTITGSTRDNNGASLPLVVDLNDATTADGLGHNGAGIVTAELDEILAAEAGPPAYALGELKAGETVTVKFRATIK